MKLINDIKKCSTRRTKSQRGLIFSRTFEGLFLVELESNQAAISSLFCYSFSEKIQLMTVRLFCVFLSHVRLKTNKPLAHDLKLFLDLDMQVIK